jgi:hypothetical protein
MNGGPAGSSKAAWSGNWRRVEGPFQNRLKRRTRLGDVGTGVLCGRGGFASGGGWQCGLSGEWSPVVRTMQSVVELPWLAYAMTLACLSREA